MDAPQLFHNKVDQAPFVTYPMALFKALTNALTGNELKIMLAYLGCKGDGSFCPSTEYMLQMTGIKDKSNFYKARRNLIAKGYLSEEENELTIDVQKIAPSAKT